MLELGENSSKLHIELAKVIKRNKISKAFLIGNQMLNLDLELKKWMWNLCILPIENVWKKL